MLLDNTQYYISSVINHHGSNSNVFEYAIAGTDRQKLLYLFQPGNIGRRRNGNFVDTVIRTA
jgi:hypothetical protein